MHLSAGILQQVAERPVQHPGRALRDGGAVSVGVEPFTGGLHADQLHAGIVDELRNRARDVLITPEDWEARKKGA